MTAARHDEEPDFGTTEEQALALYEAETGCEFCGHADHDRLACTSRWDAYSDPYGTARRKK